MPPQQNQRFASWLWQLTAEDLKQKLKNLSRIRKIKFMKKYSEGIFDHERLQYNES
jgi:hypothetical protein